MKQSRKAIMLAIVLSALFSGNAMANVHQHSVRSAVQSALGADGQIQVSITDGVATLIGYVDNKVTETKVKQAALNHPTITNLVDRIVSD